MDKTIAIIPARGGSKRLPGKNIRLLGGIPLLAHSILYAQAHPEFIAETYVSTDDAQIKAVALSFGAQVIDRPTELATDTEPTVSALRHVLSQLRGVNDVVLLQPTNPLRDPGLMARAFGNYRSGDFDSLFTVSRNHRKLGMITNTQFIPYNYKPGQRSQDLDPLYFENGALYISRSDLILEGKIMGEKAFPLVTEDAFSLLDIDTQDDFDYAEFLFEKLKR